MLVTLIGKNVKYKIVLPQIANGNYWISDTSGENEKKLINIQAQNGKWQIVSTNYAKIINTKHIKIYNDSIQIEHSQENIIDKIILKEYSMYCITVGSSNEVYILYCSPVYEKNFCELNINNTQEILIGKNINSHIVYNNALIEENHAKIFFNNGRWMIENFDKKFGTFVNDMPVLERKILFNGDVIFIMGLKIIIMGNNILVNNPQNRISCNNQCLKIVNRDIDIPNLQQEDDSEIQLYEEDEYFSRSPRITNLIECEKIRIDPPPQIQSKEDMPAILMFGSMLSMGVMSMVSIMSAIDNFISGTADKKQVMFTMLIAFAMLASMVLFPMINQKYQKKQKIKYEEKRQKRYKEYINSKIKVIDKIMTKQRNILMENYVPVEECVKIILEKGMRLWERKIEDPDFLSVRLGIGDVPLNIDIQYPEETFTMEDDNLVEILNTIANKSKTLKDAPIAMSLVEKNVSALIVKNKEKMEKFMQSLILQLITFHSYEDLKLVFLVKDEKKWEYVKMLPHVWDNTKQIRFFADNYEDMKEIARYLEEELKNRLQYQGNDINYKVFMPYYLIITDDYKKIENIKAISEILKNKVNLGFSFLCITNNLMQLPNECKTFISIDEKGGSIFESEISSTNKKQFIFDDSKTFFFDKIIKTVSNIPIKYTASGGMLLPNSYTFLEMYDVGCIEQLNILQRWRNNDATLSLKAPIGIDTTGMPIVLDIHEKFHGPHGLIAGSTGSRKK